MKKILNKIIVSTLALTLGTNIIASASVLTDKDTQYGQNNNPNTSFVSENLVEKADKYVTTKDGRYVLDSDIYKDSELSAEEIEQVKLSIEISNNTLRDSNGKFIETNDKSFEINFTDEEMKQSFEKAGINLEEYSETTNTEGTIMPMAVAVGQNKIVDYWWGYYIYLDSYYTGLALVVSEIALAAALTALLPPLAAFVGSLVGAIYLYNIAFRYGDTGSVISWNKLVGFQDVWGQ